MTRQGQGELVALASVLRLTIQAIPVPYIPRQGSEGSYCSRRRGLHDLHVACGQLEELYIAASDPTLYFGCSCKSGSLPLAHNAGHSTSIIRL